jgi:hypothetical protein
MKNASHYRALALLYRQQAAYNPAQCWHLLGQAECWEHLAEQDLASHFEECTPLNSSELAKSGATPNANDTRWKAIAVA